MFKELCMHIYLNIFTVKLIKKRNKQQINKCMLADILCVAGRWGVGWVLARRLGVGATYLDELDEIMQRG